MVGSVMAGIEMYDPGRGRIVSMVEQEQFDAGAVPREHAEIYPAVADCCPERGRVAF
jgi:hypothetical protein